ncbi:MAG: aminopeptidase [Oligoflexales bacterium]|nr:aminopeptidase [Oligoflexales bacterium]
MKDRRNEILARQLVHYSISLQKGEILYLEVKGKEALELAKDIIREATLIGAIPFWFYNDESVERSWLKDTSREQMKIFGEIHLDLMKKADAYIGLRGSDNPFNFADIDRQKLKMREELFVNPVHFDERVNRTKWVVLRYPNNAMAQLAETSLEAFENFYYEVCCLDYAKMSKSCDKLVEIIEATDMVRLTGKGTDLTFSVKGIPAIKCDGRLNIPDGEIFTAPVRNSINGTISFNTPTLFQGILFKDICLTFRDGKIIDASCEGDSRKLNEIFDSDEGARYVGEFAVGVNPLILHPMKDTLFDEKISGSIHLTPGNCYDMAKNGNKSIIHWDLVLIQRADYGGGEMWFDNKLVRKDGIFVDKELEYAFSKENLSVSSN